ncbi:hypothetical protein D3C78_1531470 [compost metagenome]
MYTYTKANFKQVVADLIITSRLTPLPVPLENVVLVVVVLVVVVLVVVVLVLVLPKVIGTISIDNGNDTAGLHFVFGQKNHTELLHSMWR